MCPIVLWRAQLRCCCDSPPLAFVAEKRARQEARLFFFFFFFGQATATTTCRSNRIELARSTFAPAAKRARKRASERALSLPPIDCSPVLIISGSAASLRQARIAPGRIMSIMGARREPPMISVTNKPAQRTRKCCVLCVISRLVSCKAHAERCFERAGSRPMLAQEARAAGCGSVSCKLATCCAAHDFNLRAHTI